VDRSFVQRLEADSGSRAIVNAIISMSRNLNLEVTAEGVETVEQFELLCAQGCHELQGFLLGRPMPQHTVRRFLSEQENPLNKPLEPGGPLVPPPALDRMALA
jgi:diguanylate cyclase